MKKFEEVSQGEGANRRVSFEIEGKDTPSPQKKRMTPLIKVNEPPISDQALSPSLSPRIRNYRKSSLGLWNNIEEDGVTGEIATGSNHIESLMWVEYRGSLRERLLDFMHEKGYDKTLDVIQASFSFTAAIIFVAETYDKSLERGSLAILVIEIIIGLFFLFDYFLSLFLAEIRSKFVLSFVSLVDLVTILPVFVDFLFLADYVSLKSGRTELPVNSSQGATTTSSIAVENTNWEDPVAETFLRVVRVCRVLRILQSWQVIQRFFVHYSHRHYRIMYLSSCILFCSAGIFLQIEYSQNLGFFSALYFFVITFSTVGYGDVKPETLLGQMFMSFTLIAIAFVLPQQMEKLRKMRQIETRNKRYKSLAADGHILLCGKLSSRALLEFLHEIYGMSHGKQDLPMCIMVPEKPSPLIKSIIRGHWLRGRVSLLIGSTLVEADLHRAKVKSAVACFLIADKDARYPAREDASVVLGASIVRKLNPNLEIFASVIDSDSSKNARRLRWAIGAKGEVFSIGLVKQQITAANIICPGAIPLLANLLRSYDLNIDEEKVSKNASLEYQWGIGFEIYPLVLGSHFHCQKFTTVARVVYSQFGSILIGVAREGQILLNPCNTRLNMGEIGFFVARGAAHINQINKLYASAAMIFREEHHNAASTAQGSSNGDGDEPDNQPLNNAFTFDASFLKNVKAGFSSNSLGVSKDSDFYSSNAAKERAMPGSVLKKRRPSSINSPSVSDDLMNTFSWASTESIFRQTSTSNAEKFKAVNHPIRRLSMRSKTSTPANSTQWKRSRNFERFNAHEPLVPESLSIYKPDELHLEGSERKLENVVLKKVDFEGHILLSFMGNKIEAIFHIISKLRVKTMAMRPIVIIGKHLPLQEDWDIISHFSDLYWFIGDPCDYSVLLAAGVKNAYHLSMLSYKKKTESFGRAGTYESDLVPWKKNTLDVAEVDYDHITTLLGLYEVRNLSGVTAEIKNISNCRFLRPEYAFNSPSNKQISSLEKMYRLFFQEHAYFMSPLFAAGYIFHASIIDRAVAQSWYNPYIITVFRTLIGGDGTFSVKRGLSIASSPPANESENHNIARRKINFTARDQKSFTGKKRERTESALGLSKKPILKQVPVPSEFVNLPFDQLFDYFVQSEKSIPLGIYRHGKSVYLGTSRLFFQEEVSRDRHKKNLNGDSKLPYLYTCPVRTSMVLKDDTVIVISPPL